VLVLLPPVDAAVWIGGGEWEQLRRPPLLCLTAPTVLSCTSVPVAHAAHYARHTCVEALNYCKPDLTTMVQQTGVLQERLQRRLLALYTPAISNIRYVMKACHGP
jgi:hypothetical protein